MALIPYGHIATEETQLRIENILQAIAAGSAGPEYTDAMFRNLLDDTNTTQIFEAWWPLSAASADSKYKRLERFFRMLQTDKTYTVKFYSPEVSTLTTGTPADDLAGKSPAPLVTDTSSTVDDWAAEDRMTWYIRANAKSLADGTMDVLAVEGEEEFDITGKLAPVYTFAPALLRKVEDDGEYLAKSWRNKMAPGFAPYAENVAPDGTRRAMTWHPTFPGGLTASGALTSGAGVAQVNYTSASAGLTAARKQTAFEGLWSDCDSTYMLEQWQLRHFDLENSRILEGCTNYNFQNKVAKAETGSKRVLLTVSQGANYIPGSTVSVGDPGASTNYDRGQAYMYNLAKMVKIVNVENVSVDGATYAAVNLDIADPIDVPATAYISTMPWHSGSTETLPGHSDGAPGNLTNGKYPCRWAGVEMMTGAYCIGLDPLWDVTAVEGGGLLYTAKACRDSEKLSGSVTANHITVAEKEFTAAQLNKWNYQLSMQPGSTESLLPDKIGGGETSGMKSAFYVTGSAGVRCPWRFGYLGVAGTAGAACANGLSAPSYASWYGVPRLAGSGKKRGEWAGF